MRRCHDARTWTPAWRDGCRLGFAASGMLDDALLLTPSRGLGGGIERYAATLEWAFAERGVRYQRIDLLRPGTRGHARILREALGCMRASSGSTRLVLMHRALLPVASALARRPEISGISVVCHGTDVWGHPSWPRRPIERYLMRREAARMVAVSCFTSGVLASDRLATILPPGLSKGWLETLLSASTCTSSGKHSGPLKSS